MFHCDKHVPGFDVSGHSSKDQERHGGRRLLQEMDNSSLEELESGGSKNCTAPGKRKWKKEDTQAFSPSLPLSLHPQNREREILCVWGGGVMGAKVGNKWSPYMSCFSTFSGPYVLASWCGVTQIVRSNDFPWAHAPAGSVHSPSHVFRILQVSLLLPPPCPPLPSRQLSHPLLLHFPHAFHHNGYISEKK